MNEGTLLTHEFVEFIPREIKDNTLYVSVAYATVVHKCCCGCGNQVTTPLSPSQWSLTFDGRSISLHPSIGNGGFECRSHYWIKKNKVEWSFQMSDKHIADVQCQDLHANRRQFDGAAAEKMRQIEVQNVPLPAKKKDGIGAKLKKRFFGKRR